MALIESISIQLRCFRNKFFTSAGEKIKSAICFKILAPARTDCAGKTMIKISSNFKEIIISADRNDCQWLNH